MDVIIIRYMSTNYSLQRSATLLSTTGYLLYVQDVQSIFKSKVLLWLKLMMFNILYRDRGDALRPVEKLKLNIFAKLLI